MYNATPKYKLFDILIQTFTSNIILCSIAMAFDSSPSPSEDSQNSSETDLNIDNMEDEMHVDTSNWTTC